METMRGNSNITALTQKRDGSFELEKVYPKWIMEGTGKKNCSKWSE